MQLADVVPSLAGRIIGVFLVVLLLILLCPWFGYLRLPSSMRWWPSRPHGPLRALSLTLKEYTGSRSSEEGYREISKHGQPFALCNPSFYPQVLLPPEHVGWLLNQPEHVLSHEKANEDIHALPFLAPGFDNYDHLELIKAIRHDLTRNIANTEHALLDELEHAADEALGPAGDQSWREVRLAEVLDQIVFAACLRVFFGVSLSRDPKFVYQVKTFTRVTGAMMILVSQWVPWPLKPLVGLVAGLPIHYYWLRLIIHLYPTFQQRIQCLQTKTDPPPTDLVTWIVDLALARNPTKKVRISALVVRLTLISFLPVDVLIAMTQHLFLDLLSADPKHAYPDILRREAETAVSSKSHPMPQTESAIRESLRLHPLSDRMLSRRVVQRPGITLPSGQFLPRGTWLAVAAVGVHRDERNYPDPDEYQPFRFVGKGAGEENKGVLVPATSERFLAFGHGMHSCPGRWFGAHVMKVAVRVILMNYEFEPLDSRPENSVVGQTIIPPLDVQVRVRGRK
ncbi:cytochrome P450 [Aspergillus coremiiformis]|uniref:Cytochrome P450 n=1 Tax=Aspergillus coremiiformis TaxID=138285 RepID=A0A5N6YX47_9EURO|nr:cytochrome P450 [Aspergillus coremiiformis]